MQLSTLIVLIYKPTGLIKKVGLCPQRRLGDAAKKAISKLQVRTIKKGDKVMFATQ